MSKKIKIDDLTNPILSEFQKAAKDYGETLKIDLHSEIQANILIVVEKSKENKS